MLANVVIPYWATTDYWSGYLWALQDTITANTRLAQGALWRPNHRKGLTDGIARVAPVDPDGLKPTALQISQLPFSLPGQPGTPPTTGTPPITGTPPNTTGNMPAWANEYWTGYILAIRDPTTARQRFAQPAGLSINHLKGITDGLTPGAAPSDPLGFVPTAAQLAQITTGAPFVVVRTPPAYVPKPNAGPPVYVPPPTPWPGLVAVTYEIYGIRNGRKVPVHDVLKHRGSRYDLARGARLMIGDEPSEGFGFGGRPGSWQSVYPNVSPSAYRLDPDKGVIQFDGKRAFAVGESDLIEIFGPNWRATVYV